MLMSAARLGLLAMAPLCLGTGVAWADCKMSILLVMPVTMSGTRAERCLVRGMLGKDLDAALADCNSAKREASSNYEFLYSRGIVQLRRKEYVKAIADLSDTIERQPRFARAIYARGLAKMGHGDRTGGEADLQAALAIDPRVARVFRDVDLGL